MVENDSNDDCHPRVADSRHPRLGVAVCVEGGGATRRIAAVCHSDGSVRSSPVPASDEVSGPRGGEMSSGKTLMPGLATNCKSMNHTEPHRKNTTAPSPDSHPVLHHRRLFSHSFCPPTP